MTEERERFLEDPRNIYSYEFGFQSLKKMSRITGLPVSKVQEKVQNVKQYNEFFQPHPIRHFRQIVGKFPNDVWSIDLFETESLYSAIKKMKQHDELTVKQQKQFYKELEEFYTINHGVKYVLVVVDVYSRYAWCKPLVNKNSICKKSY